MIYESTGYSFSSEILYLPTLNTSMNKDYHLVQSLLRSTIAYHPIFAELMGSAAGGVFLSQLHYWSIGGKAHDPDNFIYKSFQEWQTETHLSRREFESARKQLKALGLLAEERRGFKPLLWYRLDLDGLYQKIVNLSLKRPYMPIATSDISYCQILHQLPSDLTSETIYTEITSEITFKDSPESDEKFSNTQEPFTPLLANNQTASFVVNPDPVDGGKGSAACSTKPDKSKDLFGKTRSSVARKQIADEASWLSHGIANKRWKDRQGLADFVAYVEIYCENRREDHELNHDGTLYGKGYRTAILSRTATAEDDNDPMLACWKAWNLEPSAPNYIESKPEYVAVVQDSEAVARTKANHANFKAKIQARKDAESAEKARIAKLMEDLDEG